MRYSRSGLYYTPGRGITLTGKEKEFMKKRGGKWSVTVSIRMTADMKEAIRKDVPPGESFTSFMRKAILRAIGYEKIE